MIRSISSLSRGECVKRIVKYSLAPILLMVTIAGLQAMTPQ
jgi:hypothetical protein